MIDCHSVYCRISFLCVYVSIQESFEFGQLLILAVDQAADKCCYYWLVAETEDMKPAEVLSIDDSVFHSSFILFRLRAGLSFSFEHLEQNGTASVCLMHINRLSQTLLFC